MGYHIRATDKNIGYIDDFIVDKESWIIRYLVINTSNWMPGGKQVPVAPTWASVVDWENRRVRVDLASDQIKNSPEFDLMLPINREYELRLYDFYGRPYYWSSKR